MELKKLFSNLLKMMIHAKKLGIYTSLLKKLEKKGDKTYSKLYQDIYNLDEWVRDHSNQIENAPKIHERAYTLLVTMDAQMDWRKYES